MSLYSWLSYSTSYINNLLQNTGDKNTILDPLTCIVKLGILAFKPLGTKISINNNQIAFHEPGLLQGTIRWTHGDNRNDLHNLCYPIIKAMEWYNIEDPNIKNIFIFSKRGLVNLMNSYNKNSTTAHSLKHYITIITATINNQNNHTPKEDEEANHIYTELKKLWNEREINIVNNLLVEISQSVKDFEKKDILVNTLDTFLSIKEHSVNKLLTESSTILI